VWPRSLSFRAKQSKRNWWFKSALQPTAPRRLWICLIDTYQFNYRKNELSARTLSCFESLSDAISAGTSSLTYSHCGVIIAMLHITHMKNLTHLQCSLWQPLVLQSLLHPLGKDHLLAQPRKSLRRRHSEEMLGD